MKRDNNMSKTSTFLNCLIINLLFVNHALAANLDWKVVNRFPLLQHKEFFEKLELGSTQGKSVVTSLVELGKTEGALKPIKDTLWEPETGTYNREKFFERTHDIELSYEDDNLSEQRCTWFFNDVQIETSLCTKKIIYPRVKEDEGFSVGVQVDGQDKLSLNNQKIETELIIALGDSFASGEGNPDQAATFTNIKTKGRDWFLIPIKSNTGTSAEWWDQACHRSLLSWPSLFAMERAINRTKSVIRFASFACSGAEIYDGFFNPQKNPPGLLNEDTPNNVKSKNYVPGIKQINLPAQPQQQAGNLMNKEYYSEHHESALVKSQLDAATTLLCKGGEFKTSNDKYANKADGSRDAVLGKKVFFGDYTYLTCTGKLEVPTLVLLSFGGNDFGFSGIVKWGITPKTVKNDLLRPLRKVALNKARKFAGVIEPRDAKASIDAHLEKLYENLNDALKKYLGINDPGKVYALKYPDPLPIDNFANCGERLNGGNEALGQLLKDRYSINGWVFRLEKFQVKEARSIFIKELKLKQDEAMKKNCWNMLDAQVGFDRDTPHRTWCAVAENCKENNCQKSDRFAWISPNGATEKLPLLENTSDWDAYDKERTRGLRTANDAVLTQAVFFHTRKGDVEIADDWIYGMAHPTALVHATIAEHLKTLVSKQVTNN